MHFNKDGTFMTPEEFKKIQKSFELNNEKKVQAMRMNLWGWQKMETTIKHWERVGSLVSIPSGLRGFRDFKDLYGEINVINLPNINNPYKGNELDLRQDEAIKKLLSKNVGYLHASTGVGKAQPLNAKLLTDTGWTSMGNIQVGDVIFGEDGNLTRVIGVYPQGEKDIYEIIFDDGTKVESCLEHLWTVQDTNDRKRAGKNYTKNLTGRMDYSSRVLPINKTLSLREIKNNLIAFKGLANERLNYSVQLNNPINFSRKSLLIPPYILGVLIGDGNIVNRNISFSNSEKDIVNKILSLLCNGDYISSIQDDRNNSITNNICNGNSKKSLTEISDNLDKYGLLGKKSYEKFIPRNYLLSNIEDRIQLLQGLCDTDGYVVLGRNKKNGAMIEYSTTSKRLAEDIEFLVRSLGGFVKYSKRKSVYKKNGVTINCKDHYRMYLTLPNGIIPVSSKKHLVRYRESGKFNKKFIKEINFKRKELAQCIMVDNKSHLYITDDFTVTHNTMITAKIIKEKSVKTLIVVSGIELMNQMQKDLEEIFGEKYPTIDGKSGILKQHLIIDLKLEEQIGIQQSLIGNEKSAFRIKKMQKKLKLLTDQRKYKEEIILKKLDKILQFPIVIANIDTLVTLPKKEFFNKFDLTILDEVDTYLGADRRREMVWKSISSKYIYGMTGTIKVNYVSDKVFDIYFGPKTELLEKHFQPDIYKVMTNFVFGELDDMKEFHLLKKAVYEDENRNNLIIETVIETLGNNKGILFSEYVEHAKLLKDRFEQKGIKCFMLIGEVKEQERIQIKNELREHKGQCLLIGSVKIVGRGFSVSELSIGYLTTCEKFTSNISQYLGRIIRLFPGKNKCEWYDFIDPGCRLLLNQSKSRTSTYKKEYPNSKILFYN